MIQASMADSLNICHQTAGSENYVNHYRKSLTDDNMN